MAELIEAFMAASSTRLPRFAMRGISKRFGATAALQGVDLAVAPGEIHALVGENGAGKSTLMKILSGALSPDAGEMELDHQPYRPANPQAARKAGVAMIYQELSLAPHLTVRENIILGVEPVRYGFIRWKKADEMARQALAALGHPEIHPQQRVGKLSVAEQQLVEIARALAVGCRVLVLDEPTAALAGPDIEKLFAILESLKAQGQAIVYISHFLEEVKRISDRFTVLRDGKTVGGGETRCVSVGQIVEMMVGRTVEQLYPRSPRIPGEVVLEVKNLSGMKKPLSADFTLHRGEVLGIAGLVGAGRTELLRTIFGLDPLRTGKIKLGAFFGPASPAQRWARGMGLLSENRAREGLALSLGVADNLTLSKLEALGSFGFVSPARQHAAARQWIERLNIRCQSPGQRTAHLSGGNQQKVALARLLYHDVDILILDEPTRGIDVASKAEIYRIIDEVTSHEQTGGKPPKAVLMVSSYLPELLGICDRITVMKRGRLGVARPVGEWSEHDLMLEATGQ